MRNQAVTGTRLQRLAKLPRVPTTRDTGTPVKAVQGADRVGTSLGSFTSRALQYRRELHWDYARVFYGSSRAGRRVLFFCFFHCSVLYDSIRRKTNKKRAYATRRRHADDFCCWEYWRFPVYTSSTWIEWHIFVSRLTAFTGADQLVCRHRYADQGGCGQLSQRSRDIRIVGLQTIREESGNSE